MKQTTSSLQFPAPTKYSPISTSGRDFLGEQPIIQYMADDCLPSFTNSTSYIRYFTFWAWAVKTAKKNLSRNEIPKELWKYLARLEVFFIWANKTYNPGITGLPGSDKAGINFLELTGEQLSDKLDFIKMKISSPVSYSSPYYKPSIGRLDVVTIEDDQFVLKHFGQELADEFDKQVQNSSGYSELVSPRNKQLTLHTLSELREKFYIKNLTLKEREILINMIVHDETNSEKGELNTNRVHSALLLLDIIAKYAVKDKIEIHEILLDPHYSPPEYLHNILGGYKIVELRRHYQLGTEAILYSFLKYICKSQGLEGGSYTEFCDSVTDFIESRIVELGIAHTVDTQKNFNIIFGLLSTDEYKVKNLAKLAMRLKGKFRYNRNQFSLDNVVEALLLILWVSMQASELNTYNSALANQFLKYKLYSRFSLNEVNSVIQDCKALSLRQGIEKLIIHLSLNMHLSVANHKLFSTGNFTFRFSRGDGLKFVKIEDMNLPGSTANKLFSFFDILEDLDLISRKGKNHFEVQDRGKEFIAEYC
jgi:hypothetical protein